MRGRHPSPGALGWPDLAGAAMLLLFATAVAAPGARARLLAAATLAAAAWIACDGLAGGRPGPRARLVMAFGLTMLAALPALLLAFDHGLWIAPPRLHGLNAGLALWSVGIAAIAVGSRVAGFAARLSHTPVSGTPITARGERGPRAVALVAVIVLVCLGAFVHEVGGPVAYFKDLNNSAAANAGLTYLIWGISFAKYAAFAYLGESWAAGRRPSRQAVAAAAIAILLLLFLGSRLLVLVAAIQLLLLYAALRPLDRRFKLALLAATLAGAVVLHRPRRVPPLGERTGWAPRELPDLPGRHRASVIAAYVRRQLRRHGPLERAGAAGRSRQGALRVRQGTAAGAASTAAGKHPADSLDRAGAPGNVHRATPQRERPSASGRGIHRVRLRR